MDLIQELKRLFDEELISVDRQIDLVNGHGNTDKSIEERYRELLGKHKELLDIVEELLEGVTQSSVGRLSSHELLEQNYNKLWKRNLELFHMCAYDALTEVYSRKFIFEAIENEIMKSCDLSKPFVIAMIDIDNFKAVNDQEGHQVGDRLLKYIASIMKSTIRPNDLLGRYGGDEFIVLLPGTPEDVGHEVLGRIRRDIETSEKPCLASDIQITASFGCIAYDGTRGVDHQELIYYADQALLKAKKEGKNQVCVYKHMEVAV